MQAVRSLLDAEHLATGRRRAALIETYGCQQNEADSDRMRGMLAEMGFAPAEDRAQADLILFNTCAIREHAELRVFGNIGALKHQKQRNPNLMLGITGCMMQQPHRVEEILSKYGQVDFILGTHTFYLLPGVILGLLQEGRRQALVAERTDAIPEDLPVRRESAHKAWVTVMYGCNNFCAYCVVPHTRGREISRRPEHILGEVRGLVLEGCRDITLLGQNVNSYGRDLGGEPDFADLLADIDKIEGDYRLRFMTSHPKDATQKLFDAMANSVHVARQLHLPVQSGSDRVLAAMNRRYTAAAYAELAARARAAMPDLVLTSDIIVGFPGETEQEFEETLALVRALRFDALFTFAFSRRKNTAAYTMKEQVPKEEKQRRLSRLMEVQQEISLEKNRAHLGQVLSVLAEGPGKGGLLQGRTEGGKLCYFAGPQCLIGQFAPVRITEAKTFVLYGELSGSH
ncbi:MAG: tRNA (N6-isopentenyl adenosine(37)-C2)-methylthiotransferase MiaB [Clostridiales bacterium]|nr:tRNA (N6-isopentenyl adenosine(37)-C2)-methylthiotransferase MiaB [Clostridiales bacterium]